MKEKSKTRTMRENVWWRKIIRINPNWKQTLKAIKKVDLKRKVACICWWDLIDRKHNEDLSVLAKHMRKYKYVDYTFEDSDLRDELHKIGYPIDMAIKRSRTPKSSLVRRNKRKVNNERITKRP